MTRYSNERDIDAELKAMWDNAMAELHKVSTRTRIKVIEEKVQEHESKIETFVRGFLQIAGGIGKKK